MKKGSKGAPPSGTGFTSLSGGAGSDDDFEEDAQEMGEMGDARGEALMDGAEQLTNPELQQWAFGLCCAGMPLVIWAQSVPLSCVYMEQEQIEWPNKNCNSKLRLYDFCLKSCMQHQCLYFVIFLCLALVLQALVVIMNHAKCRHFLKFAFAMDFQKQTDELESKLNELEHTDEASSTWWKQVKIYFKKAFVNVMMALRESCSKSSTQRVLLTPRVLVRFSQMCIFGALCTIGMLIVNNFSIFPPSLKCGNETLHLKYDFSWYHMSGHGVAMFILATVFFLQYRSKFSVQVKFKKVNVLNLRNQFRKHKKNYYLKSADMVHQRKLKKMYLRQLEKVEHGSQIDDPRNAFRFRDWKDPITLHFKLRKPMKWPFAENKHRIAAIYTCFVTALLFTTSSHLCWLCVESVELIQNASSTQMETYINLLGACGRHSPIGVGSIIGSFLLGLACIIQSMLWKLTDPEAIGNNTPANYSGCLKAIRELHPEAFASQQLWVKLFSETLGDTILDTTIYEKAGQTEKSFPEIWCYVWVTSDKTSADNENVMNVPIDTASTATPSTATGSAAAGPAAPASGPAVTGPTAIDQQDDRKRWRKSTQPRKVKLVRPPDQLDESLRGLVRDEYGIPVLAVKVLDGGEERRQMVPLQFVAGGPTVWLNLGRKHSWEKVSGAFVFLAIVIVVTEILFSFFYSYGQMLSSCDDVLNTQCTYYAINQREEHHPIQFRRTLGTWMAIAGCVLATVSCMCIRVANQVDAGKVDSCCCAYICALYFILENVCGIVFFIFKSPWMGLYACCKRNCWCAQKGDGEGREDSSDDDPLD